MTSTTADYARILWQIAVTAPVALALLIAGVVLLAKRRVAPRACTLAGVTFLVLFLFHTGMYFFRVWMFGTYNPGVLGRGGSWTLQDLELLLRLSNVVTALVDAAGVAALAAAVLIGRRPFPRPED
jgi:hypothetical protein